MTDNVGEPANTFWESFEMFAWESRHYCKGTCRSLPVEDGNWADRVKPEVVSLVRIM
jgi:hypothetical protein